MDDRVQFASSATKIVVSEKSIILLYIKFKDGAMQPMSSRIKSCLKKDRLSLKIPISETTLTPKGIEM
jgi:hypothetical protein